MSKGKHLTLLSALALVALVGAALAAPAAQAEGTGGASPYSAKTNARSVSSVANLGSFTFTAWRSGGASWYGPGLYGNSTACGQRLRPRTVGVAHKTLPCGTVVKFRHRGRTLVTRVIDRGPYISGRAWDLTEAASEVLAFESVGVGPVRYAIGSRYARNARR